MNYQDAYKQGFIYGITAYAWHKNGQQFVGTTGKTLKEAVERVEKTWNYAPPNSAIDAAKELARDELAKARQNEERYRQLVAHGCGRISGQTCLLELNPVDLKAALDAEKEKE